MHIDTSFLFGSILGYNNHVGTPNLTLMIVASLGGVGDDM